MSVGVFTRKKRVTFVDGQETPTPDPGFVACGDGTGFPMLVTLEQLAEILYRVKDAGWTSGTAEQIKVNIDDEQVASSVVTFTSASPPTEKVEWELSSLFGGDYWDAAYTRRGYVAVNNDSAPDKPMDNTFDGYFSDVAYITVDGLLGNSTSSIAYREAIQERAMWANKTPLENERIERGCYEENETVTALDTYIDPPDDPFRTGFSFFGSSWIDSWPYGTYYPSIYAPYSTSQDLQPTPGDIFPYLGATVELTFDGQVAWVDANNSGNPFDPLNRLYIGVNFRIRNSFSGTSALWAFSTNTSDLDDPAISSSALLKLKLSGTDQYVTAPIYVDQYGFDSPTYTYEAGYVTDWIFEATEWWPYAKAGGPVWNSATGAKL